MPHTLHLKPYPSLRISTLHWVSLFNFAATIKHAGMLHIQVFAFSPIQENTYVLYTPQGNALIIDPGCYFTAEEEQLQQFITAKGLTVKYLLQTHCHLDHVFGSKWVHQQYATEMHLHEAEAKMLQWAPESGRQWGLPFQPYQGPLHYLKAGDTIVLDGNELQVLLVPGHSPGSIAFYCKAQDFVISGDVLFRASVGRTDLPFSSFEQLENSIRTQLYTLPNHTVVYPGHGTSTTIGYEKRNNPFVNEL